MLRAMSQRIFVTGGSGFVGGAVVEELVSRGYGINALVNQKELSVAGDVRSFKGGLFDPSALDAAMRDCAAVIHLVGIIMEDPVRGVTFEKIHFQGTQAIVDAAVRGNVKRYIQMSAVGTRANALSNYHKTKWKAEEYVRKSGLDWTIIRPSMIHGPRGKFVKMEIKWARKQAPPFLFMPYFGRGLLGLGGSTMLQPVYVKDVARAFVDAIGNPKTVGKTYNLGGSQQLTWPQMHRAFAIAYTGKIRLAAPIPAWWANFLTHIVPGKLLPFNRDQVIMSQEDNTADLTDFVKDFGWTPGAFEKDLAGYAKA